jgi:chorismate-pyruvate lyase
LSPAELDSIERAAEGKTSTWAREVLLKAANSPVKKGHNRGFIFNQAAVAKI